MTGIQREAICRARCAGVGYKNSIRQPAWLNIAERGSIGAMFASLLYLALLRLLTLVAPGYRSDDAAQIEILVLRHEPAMLNHAGRLKTAGLGDHVHPHMFRRTYAHKMLAGGMNETDLTTLAGWRSRTMVSRYAASAATERATEVGKRLSPGDKL